MPAAEAYAQLPPHLRGIVKALLSTASLDGGVQLPPSPGYPTSSAPVAAVPSSKMIKSNSKCHDYTSIFKSIGSSITEATETNKRLQAAASATVPKPANSNGVQGKTSPPDSPRSDSTYVTNDSGSPMELQPATYRRSPPSSPGSVNLQHSPSISARKQANSRDLYRDRTDSAPSVSIIHKDGKVIIVADIFPEIKIEAENSNSIRVRTIEPLSPSALPDYEIDVLYDNVYDTMFDIYVPDGIPIPLDEYTRAPSECLNDQEHIWDDTAPNSPELAAQPTSDDEAMAPEIPKLEPVSIAPASSKEPVEPKQHVVPKPASVAPKSKDVSKAKGEDEVKEDDAKDKKDPKDVRPQNTRTYASALMRFFEVQATEQFSAGFNPKRVVGKEPSKADLEAKYSKKFPCNHEYCMASYRTAIDLQDHKEEFHEFCKKCDLDFENGDLYHLHKLEAWKKHITCPLCSEDFKSSGGRDRHIKQMHMRDQKITCRGCGQIFSRAGGMLHHIESNLCTQFTSDQFEMSRAKQAFRLGQISALMVTEDDRSEGIVEIGLDGDCVPVESTLAFDDIPQDDDEAFRRAFPLLHSPNGVDDAFEEKSPRALANITRSVKETPKASGPSGFVSPNFAKQTGFAATEPSRIMSTPVVTPRIAPGASEGIHRSVLPPEIENLAMKDKRDVMVLRDYAGNFFDPTSPSFNPEIYRNVIGKYKCPYPGCGKSFGGRKEFITHLCSPTHRGVDSRCPSCLKSFKSPTALTSHMESPSNRCRIKESTHFDTAVSLVSGGFLEVTGRHEGGEIMYDAADPNSNKVSFLV